MILGIEFLVTRNDLKNLLYRADIHNQYFIEIGYAHCFLTSDIMEHTVKEHKWLSKPTVPLWFRHTTIESCLAFIKHGMKSENYHPQVKPKGTDQSPQKPPRRITLGL
jgi:hypothetical protein